MGMVWAVVAQSARIEELDLKTNISVRGERVIILVTFDSDSGSALFIKCSIGQVLYALCTGQCM